MKDHLFSRTGAGSSRAALLRKRLDDLGNVFEFVTMTVDQDARGGAGLHRYALTALYDQIMASQRDWHQRVIRKLPIADYPEPSMSWNLDDAVGEELSQQQLANLLRTDIDAIGIPALYLDFIRPLSLPKVLDAAGVGRALFTEWVDTIGLLDQCDVVAFSWLNRLGQPLSAPLNGHNESAVWTDFFHPGSLPDYAWCLTVWNPERRTISAFAVCSTRQM